MFNYNFRLLAFKLQTFKNCNFQNTKPKNPIQKLENKAKVKKMQQYIDSERNRNFVI